MEKCQQPIVSVGRWVDYLGVRWTVQSIHKTFVVLVAVGNPGRTTRVDLQVFEQLV